LRIAIDRPASGGLSRRPWGYKRARIAKRLGLRANFYNANPAVPESYHMRFAPVNMPARRAPFNDLSRDPI
jgi:hypothetical protein